MMREALGAEAAHVDLSSTSAPLHAARANPWPRTTGSSLNSSSKDPDAARRSPTSSSALIPTSGPYGPGTRRCSTAPSSTCRHGCSAPTDANGTRIRSSKASGKHTQRSSPATAGPRATTTRTPTNLLASHQRPRPAPLTGLAADTIRPRSAEELREQLVRETRHRQDKRRAVHSTCCSPPPRIANNAMQHGGGIQEVRAGRARGTLRLRDPRPRATGSTIPSRPISHNVEGIGAGLWVRPTADLADRVLPLANGIHRTHLALGDHAIGGLTLPAAPLR